MKIHFDLDCYFVSAERTRYAFLKDKNVVVAKSSDKKIFSKDKKQGVILGDTGAFNSVLEFKNSYDTNNILKAWRDEFLDENGDIHGIVIAKSYALKWRETVNGTTKYPELPFDQKGEVYYSFLTDFTGSSAEVLFDRTMEWLAINYGLIPSYLYSNKDNGKIIY